MMSFIVLSFANPRSCFRLCVAPSRVGSLRVGYDIDPLRVRGGLGPVIVVPVPPLVRRGLGIALRRVLPLLLAPARSYVKVAPGAAHCLVAAVVDEVGAKYTLAVAEERVRAVPLVHAEVGVEAILDGVPRHLPAHPRLHARDVSLRRTRGEREGGVAGVQMGEVGDLVGTEGAAAAGMLGPAEHVEHAHLTFRPFELILLLHGQPRHPATLGGQRVTGAGEGLLLHEELLARCLPLLWRHDRWCLHCEMPFLVLNLSLLARSHFISP